MPGHLEFIYHILSFVCSLMYCILGAILNSEKYSTEPALREVSMTLITYFVLISYRISETGESKENAGVSTWGIII